MKRSIALITLLLISACHSMDQSKETTNIVRNNITELSDAPRKKNATSHEKSNVFGSVFMRKHCAVELVAPGAKDNDCGKKQPKRAAIFISSQSIDGKPGQTQKLKSNEEGQFSLYLPAGKYTLKAEMKPLAQSQNITFVVNESSDSQVPVELFLKFVPR